MRTNELIEQLVSDLRPLSSSAGSRRLLAAIGIGALLSLALVWITLGPRADFIEAVYGSLGLKWVFGSAMAGIACWLCTRFARPEAAPSRLLWLVMIPVLLPASLGLIELGSTPSEGRARLLLGMSAAVCPWIISGLAVPVFVGAVWWYRSFAPTAQRLAGFSAGLLAGAVGTVVYAIHCTEDAAAFVAVWYSMGMIAPALLGLLLGPRLLRW